MALCLGYALVRGGAPERVGALMQVAAFVLTIALHRTLDAVGFRAPNLATAVVDVALLVALVCLAVRSTRFWPLWLAGWQLAANIAHLAKLLDPGMQATGYAVQAQIWAYPMILATAAGAWRYRARCRAGVVEPAWKPLPA